MENIIHSVQTCLLRLQEINSFVDSGDTRCYDHQLVMLHTQEKYNVFRGPASLLIKLLKQRQWFLDKVFRAYYLSILECARVRLWVYTWSQRFSSMSAPTPPSLEENFWNQGNIRFIFFLLKIWPHIKTCPRVNYRIINVWSSQEASGSD